MPDVFVPSVVQAYAIYGVDLVIGDALGSHAAEWIANELRHDEYGLDKISFAPGDTVVDVGAHVGVFAIYLAKRQPDVRIIALEPDPTNFRNLRENLVRNEVHNVIAENLAVTRDRRPFPIDAPPTNSGGSGGYYRETQGYRHAVARSITLDDVFAKYAVATCKLLKMDCEGAEHEILTSTTVLGRVQWFSAEFHINENLIAMGCSSESLIGIVGAHVDHDRIAIHAIRMGE
jgi:FkbM family methyltransferase